MDPAKPLIAIAGPTGSGKSDIGLRVAEAFHGEIINCDSLQLYRYLDIGTAKLRPDERRGIPHHLMDILEPDEVFTAGEYARRARSTLEDITSRGRLPVVVGGTGFYLRALFEGLFPGPQRNEALRVRLAARERRRPASLHRILRRIDPQAAARIHANDVPKVVRALEVCLLARRPVTELYREGRDPLTGYAPLKIGLFPPREALFRNLDERCRLMFERGLIEEVRGILSRGFSHDAKAFESLGYKQAVQVIRGELTEREAISYAQRDTRRYAKRQMTWFRKEPQLEILAGFGSDPATREAVLTRVRRFTKKS
jgi:tRNA dimethylallyltransferase